RVYAAPDSHSLSCLQSSVLLLPRVDVSFCRFDLRATLSFPTRRPSDLFCAGWWLCHRSVDATLGGRHQRHHGLAGMGLDLHGGGDRKSTRLNSSHVKTSYAVSCLKKKNHKTFTRSAAPLPPSNRDRARH